MTRDQGRGLSPGLSIVCSDQARNGKTLLASLFAEHLIHAGRDVRVFDLDSPVGKIARRFVGRSSVIDLSRTHGIMALFDTVVSARPRDYVVDLPHFQLDRFFALVEEIDVLREAERTGLATTVFYLCDPSFASIAHARFIKSQLRNTRFIIVRNEAVRAFNPDPEVARAYNEICKGGYIVLPHVDSATMAYITNGIYSFRAFLQGETPAIPAQKQRPAQGFFGTVQAQFEQLQLTLDIDHLRDIGVV